MPRSFLSLDVRSNVCVVAVLAGDEAVIGLRWESDRKDLRCLGDNANDTIGGSDEGKSGSDRLIVSRAARNRALPLHVRIFARAWPEKSGMNRNGEAALS